jgi:hypothetical protein
MATNVLTCCGPMCVLLFGIRIATLILSKQEFTRVTKHVKNAQECERLANDKMMILQMIQNKVDKGL